MGRNPWSEPADTPAVEAVAAALFRWVRVSVVCQTGLFFKINHVSPNGTVSFLINWTALNWKSTCFFHDVVRTREPPRQSLQVDDWACCTVTESESVIHEHEAVRNTRRGCNLVRENWKRFAHLLENRASQSPVVVNPFVLALAVGTCVGPCGR